MITKQDLRHLFWTAFFGTLLLLIMGSCATQKRCFELFPPEIRTDTITKTKIEYRDSIVEIYIPGDTINGEITVDYEGGLFFPPETSPPVLDDSVVLTPGPEPIRDTARVVGKLAAAKAWIEEHPDPGKAALRLELIEFEQILQVKLDSVIQIKDHFEHLYTVEIHKEPPKVPWIYKALIPVAGVLLLLLIFCIRYRR
jgi:hypothetical protein